MIAMIMRFLTGKAVRWLVSGVLLSFALSAGYYIASQLRKVGSFEAQLVQSRAESEVPSAKIDGLRAQFDDLSTVLRKKAAADRVMQAKFAKLVAAAKEIEDACTSVPVPDSYLEQLRQGAAEAGRH